MNDQNTLTTLLSFLSKLDEGRLPYSLSNIRIDAIMVKIDVPGEHWEVEFFPDGTVDVERFKSNGEIFGVAALGDLFKNFAEPPDCTAEGVNEKAGPKASSEQGQLPPAGLPQAGHAQTEQSQRS